MAICSFAVHNLPNGMSSYAAGGSLSFQRVSARTPSSASPQYAAGVQHAGSAAPNGDLRQTEGFRLLPFIGRNKVYLGGASNIGRETKTRQDAPVLTGVLVAAAVRHGVNASV